MSSLTKPDLLRGLDPSSVHIAVANHGKPGEIAKNRKDLETMLRRHVTGPVFPEILSWDPLTVEDADPVAVTFKGRGLFTPGWARAATTIGTVAADNALVWTAVLPGKCGNNLTVEYATGGALSIAVSGSDITVTLNTGVTTAGDIVTALASAAEAKRMVSVANATGSGGTGLATVMAAHQHLEDGAGERLLTAYLQTAQGSNKDLIFRARRPGVSGNGIAVAYVDGGAGYATPVVTTAGYAITVTCHAGTTTAATILAALRAHTNAKALVDVDLAPGSTGAGAPSAFSHTHLSDHSTDWNAGWVPFMGNQAITTSDTTGIDSLTDDTMVVTFPGIISPQVITGGITLKLPVCGVVHRLHFTAVTSV